VPLISIVLPTYNGARYLREAIDSCLQQTLRDFELIVVVDGSTDETEAILAGYDDPRLVVVKQANQGLPRALNAGFARARAPYWTWTSDDNAYMPEALQVMARHLDTHPKTGMVCTDFLAVDDAGHTLGYHDTAWACFLYRADLAREVGEYRPEYRLVEDVDFFLRLKHRAGGIDRIGTAHYRYREHRNSLTYQHVKKRHLVSLKMHYDLASRGIEELDLRELFFDRLGNASLHRDHEAMSEMVAFAREKQVPFLAQLERRDRALRTPPGWLYNRVRVALRSRMQRVSTRVKLLARR
jgi:glycosyltransferase involved in cell wall biosynthesis